MLVCVCTHSDSTGSARRMVGRTAGLHAAVAKPTADFGIVPATATADQPVVRDAAKIVVDAPIGLPDDADQGCKARPCDLGVKKVDRHGSAVLSFCSALRWRIDPLAKHAGQRNAEQPSNGGATSAACCPPSTPPTESSPLALDATLESHPELVFAALAGKLLPADAKKSTLIGLLVRLGLIAKWGVRVDEEAIAGWGSLGADNFVDAAAMAIVADEWLQRADISVITDADGTLKQLSSMGSVIT